MRKIDKRSVKNLAVDLLFKDRSAPDFLYLLDRAIREITQRNQSYEMTELLESTLKKYNLINDNKLNMNQMRKLNKKLKQVGFSNEKDSIQIEHWKEVVEMKNDLMKMDLGDNIESAVVKIESYFLNETNCFFKLRYHEYELQKRLKLN